MERVGEVEVEIRGGIGIDGDVGLGGACRLGLLGVGLEEVWILFTDECVQFEENDQLGSRNVDADGIGIDVVGINDFEVTILPKLEWHGVLLSSQA